MYACAKITLSETAAGSALQPSTAHASSMAHTHECWPLSISICYLMSAFHVLHHADAHAILLTASPHACTGATRPDAHEFAAALLLPARPHGQQRPLPQGLASALQPCRH